MRGVLEALDADGRRVHVVSHGGLPDLRPSELRTATVRPASAWYNAFPRLHERWNNLRRT